MLTIDDLPTEIISYILDLLDWRNLLITAAVDKRFRAISDSHPKWRALYNLYFSKHYHLEQEVDSYKLPFLKLYQATFSGLSPEVHNFFEAVITNRANEVKQMLGANLKLIKATSAAGYDALDYARGNYNDLHLDLISYNLDYLERKITSIGDNPAKREKIVDLILERAWIKVVAKYNHIHLNQTNNQQLVNDLLANSSRSVQPEPNVQVILASTSNGNNSSQTHLNNNELIELEPNAQVNRSYKKPIALLVLGLFSLALLGLGISIFIGAPLLVTALASVASAVSITAVTVGAIVLIGTLIGILHGYQSSILSHRWFKKRQLALNHNLQQERQVIPNYADHLATIPVASNADVNTSTTHDSSLVANLSHQPVR